MVVENDHAMMAAAAAVAPAPTHRPPPVLNDVFFMERPIYRKVEQLFKLLDLDDNGCVDISEARTSLVICFAAVHQGKPSNSTVGESVERQVHWLFKDEDKSARISLDAFKGLYKELLEGGYEEEVLHIDIDRAISALASSRASFDRKTSSFHEKVRSFFKLMDANHDGVLEKHEAARCLRVVIAEMKAASPHTSPLKPAQGRLKDDATVGQQVKWLFAHADTNHDSKMSLAEFEQCYHDLYTKTPEPEVLELDVERGIKILQAHNTEVKTSDAS